MPHVQPEINKRRECMKEFGDDWSDKPVCPLVSAFVVVLAYRLATERYAAVDLG